MAGSCCGGKDDVPFQPVFLSYSATNANTGSASSKKRFQVVAVISGLKAVGPTRL